MDSSKNATSGANTGSGTGTTRESSLLIDVQDLSAMLQCSTRHIYRLCDLGRMPRPYKIGALCRWDRAAIESWVRNGCPKCNRSANRERD